MKRFVRLLCALSLLSVVGSSASAASWEDEKKSWEEYANSRNERDPGYAAKLSLNFLPIDNGHFYVGEVGKGIWFSVGQTVSLAAVAIPLLNSQGRSKQERDPVWTTGMIVSASVGGLGYLFLKVWSAYDAADGARRYNEAARQKREARLEWNLSPEGIYLSRRW